MRRVSTITVIAGMAIGLTVPAAGAATRHGRDGWEPYRTQPFDSVGRCSFTVHGDIVRDEEEDPRHVPGRHPRVAAPASDVENLCQTLA